MSTIKSVYFSYLNKINKNGNVVYKTDKDKIKEVMGNYYFIDDPLGLKYSLRYNNYSSDEFFKDLDNVDWCNLKKEVLTEYIENKDLKGPYTYPNRLYKWFGVDQFKGMIDRLKDFTWTNRSVSVMLDPVKDAYPNDTIPCLQCLQFIIRDGKLYLHCFFRSNDVYNAFPANMYFLTYIGLSARESLGVGFGGLYYYCSSGHYYMEFDGEISKKCIFMP